MQVVDGAADGIGVPVDSFQTVQIDGVARWSGDTSWITTDTLVVEEPLEIRLAGCRVAVTMRTPGDDLDLAAGFLYTEGIIQSAGDISTIAHCPTDDSASMGNVVNINPTDPGIVDPSRWDHNFSITSSCGICGKASIESIRQEVAPVHSEAFVTQRTLYRLEETLRSVQSVFHRTGGLHAAAVFDLEGNLLLAREDIGRHNAVDKVVGSALRRGWLPLHDYVLVVSSRASFEIVQKALMAGITILATVSAPASLAVQLASSAGMTLIGFLRIDGNGDGRFNVYTGEQRVHTA
ncbi:MAG: formate dehydrogenase accessory sulfurtransferase FdhD [Chloroflexota bacterium]